MRAARRGFLIAALAVTAARPAAAQAVRATVTDAATGAPVAEALVRVQAADGAVAAAGFTTQDGSVVLRMREGGTYAVRAERAGYLAAAVDGIAVGPEGVVAVAVRMAQRPFSMDTVQVVARSRDERGRDAFERRRAMNEGVFLDSAYLASRYERSIDAADLMRGVPGIVVPPSIAERTPRSLRGWRCMVMLLDGRPFKLTFPDGGGRKLHDVIIPRDVVAVEVYREFTEVPPEFRRYAESGMYHCGVYLYWTRVRW
jgi:hypothetical protein